MSVRDTEFCGQQTATTFTNVANCIVKFFAANNNKEIKKPGTMTAPGFLFYAVLLNYCTYPGFCGRRFGLLLYSSVGSGNSRCFSCRVGALAVP